MSHARALVFTLLVPFAATQAPPQQPPQQQQLPLPSLAATTSAYDCAAAAALDLPALLDRLAGEDVVFLGETHIDDTTHRVELAVLEGLLERRAGKVVLSMEMFERDVQQALDDYLAGRIDEAAFLHRSRPWGNYAVDYRPLVEAAKAAGIPVVAANFPAPLRRKLGMGGKEALAKLTEAERALLPTEIFPASDAYWERVDRAVRGHSMSMGSGQSQEERLYDGQNLWDNAMGDNVAKAVAAHPGSLVLHIAGGFHVAWRDGTFAQFRRRNDAAKAKVVEILAIGELYAARPEVDAEQADYLVYARSLARSENDDTLAVSVPAELRYRLQAPTSGPPKALLVWLPERGARAVDAMAFWQRALGDEVAIAVVEPPFPEQQDDLAMGGRYVYGDGFRADYGRMVAGLERIVEYVSRRYHVAQDRVCIAGAGDGGAAVLWTALYGQWLAAAMLAVDPTDLVRLSMEALPDQKPAMRSLVLAGQKVPPDALAKVAVDYQKVGGAAEVAAFDGSSARLCDLVRARLALPPVERPATDGDLLFVLERDLPRARQWAELVALDLARRGASARVVLAGDVPADAPAARVRRLAVGAGGTWPVATFESGAGLPLAGGPFGGTTVLVLPEGIADADRAAWLDLAAKKAIKRRSMFANLAIAGPGAASLPDLMADFKKRGRSRVLIVPAEFCADAATMRKLKEQLGGAGDGMDVSWPPGLGAELAATR